MHLQISFHSNSADSLMRTIVSLHLSFVGFVGNLEEDPFSCRERCEQIAVKFVGRKDPAVSDVCETREAPLPGGGRRQNS